MIANCGKIGRWAVLGLALLWLGAMTAGAAEPIKIGFSMALTGGSAGVGKQVLLALEIWRDDVNAKGGLLGRPVELVYYDDQTNPANVPGIYTKLIEVDHVDLLVGPYATNMVAPAIPAVMQHNKTLIGILANSANSEFHYPRYFVMNSTGPEPKKAYSTGFFTLAKAQSPAPRTVAIAGADAEFGQNATEGARENAKAFGFDIVYDKHYPPSTTDYAPILRAIQATHPDLVFVAAYPPDTVGIIRAASEIGLDTKMFGGVFVGLGTTSVKMQLGPLTNGLVSYGAFFPAPTFMFPGTRALLDAYEAKAASLGIDPLGWTFPPFGYAAGQVLAAAVTATNSLDDGKIADYLHRNSVQTVVGEITFSADGEWSKTHVVLTQIRGITDNSLDQVKDVAHDPIVWPAEVKTGDLIYPYSAAKTP
jgi:branched-chain amino acid transport system substrate-binding protein